MFDSTSGHSPKNSEFFDEVDLSFLDSLVQFTSSSSEGKSDSFKDVFASLNHSSSESQNFEPPSSDTQSEFFDQLGFSGFFSASQSDNVSFVDGLSFLDLSVGSLEGLFGDSKSMFCLNQSKLPGEFTIDMENKSQSSIGSSVCLSSDL